MVFLATIVAHVILCRLLLFARRSPWWSIVVFPIGGIGVIGDIGEIGVFSAGSLLWLLWFAIAASGSVSPNGRMLAVLAKSGPLTKRALLSSVTAQELIGRRLRRLVKKKFIKQEAGRLIITGKGKRLLWLLQLPARLLRWRELPIGGWQ